MAVDTSSFFTQVIQDHLELKRRNAELDPTMPLDRYLPDDPFENHPLFKTEEQARQEETMDGVDPELLAQRPTVLNWPGEDSVEIAPSETPANKDPSLWSRSRDFDWGD